MKLKNVVEGTQIEAKRNTTGECGEAIAKGAVLDVAEVLEECPRGTYCVRVEAEYLEDGFAWVVPADFRKVKEVSVEEVTEKPTEHVYKVDDKVLVGSEGAGFGYVDPELADKVCTVTAAYANGCLRVFYPEVTPTHGYLTYPRYVSPCVFGYAPVQEHLPQTYMQVGDYILSSGSDPKLEMGVPYKVVGFYTNGRLVGIALHTSTSEHWQERYCLTMQDYSTVLREVKPDADTPT